MYYSIMVLVHAVLSFYCLSTVGLSMLRKLETLSLAHNLLQADALTGPCLSSLSQLKKLDLGHNLLNQVPQIICEIQMYVSALPEVPKTAIYDRVHVVYYFNTEWKGL